MRISELDALRGLAALGVLLFHFTTQYQKEVGHIDTLAPSFSFGDFGVQLFFLISGYVIIMTLERTNTASDFLVSRFSRIYPAYWAAIGMTAVVVYTFGIPTHRLPPGEVLLNLTMLQELFRARHLDGSYWTLQIELLFYLQMFFWSKMKMLKHIRWIIMGWLVLVLAYSIGDKTHHELSWTVGQLLLVQHILFFAIGILFFHIQKDLVGSRRTYALIGACLIGIGITRQTPYFLAAITCTAVFLAIRSGWMRWLVTPILVFFGSISYSLYLLHQDIGFAVMWHLEHDAGLSSALAIPSATILCIAIATVLTYTIERPAMKWIRNAWRVRPGREAPVA